MRFSLFFLFSNTYIHRLPRCGLAYWVHICAREDCLATTRRNSVRGVSKYSPTFFVTYCFNFLDWTVCVESLCICGVVIHLSCPWFCFQFKFLSVCRNAQRKIPKQKRFACIEDFVTLITFFVYVYFLSSPAVVLEILLVVPMSKRIWNEFLRETNIW